MGTCLGKNNVLEEKVKPVPEDIAPIRKWAVINARPPRSATQSPKKWSISQSSANMAEKLSLITKPTQDRRGQQQTVEMVQLAAGGRDVAMVAPPRVHSHPPDYPAPTSSHAGKGAAKPKLVQTSCLDMLKEMETELKFRRAASKQLQQAPALPAIRSKTLTSPRQISPRIRQLRRPQQQVAPPSEKQLQEPISAPTDRKSSPLNSFSPPEPPRSYSFSTETAADGDSDRSSIGGTPFQSKEAVSGRTCETTPLLFSRSSKGGAWREPSRDCRSQVLASWVTSENESLLKGKEGFIGDVIPSRA